MRGYARCSTLAAKLVAKQNMAQTKAMDAYAEFLNLVGRLRRDIGSSDPSPYRKLFDALLDADKQDENLERELYGHTCEVCGKPGWRYLDKRLDSYRRALDNMANAEANKLLALSNSALASHLIEEHYCKDCSLFSPNAEYPQHVREQLLRIVKHIARELARSN
jgi:hypothetical protein